MLLSPIKEKMAANFHVLHWQWIGTQFILDRLRTFNAKTFFCGGLKIILSAQHNFSFQIRESLGKNTDSCVQCFMWSIKVALFQNCHYQMLNCDNLSFIPGSLNYHSSHRQFQDETNIQKGTETTYVLVGLSLILLENKMNSIILQATYYKTEKV